MTFQIWKPFSQSKKVGLLAKNGTGGETGAFDAA